MTVDEWQRDEPPAPVPDLTQLRLLATDAAGRAAAMLAGACPAAEADDPLDRRGADPGYPGRGRRMPPGRPA